MSKSRGQGFGLLYGREVPGCMLLRIVRLSAMRCNIHKAEWLHLLWGLDVGEATGVDGLTVEEQCTSGTKP